MDGSELPELAQPGAGRVIVVDADGSLDQCMLGDNMAATAAGNGWAGIVVVGAVRDANALSDVPLGIKALGTNPARPTKGCTPVLVITSSSAPLALVSVTMCF